MLPAGLYVEASKLLSREGPAKNTGEGAPPGLPQSGDGAGRMPMSDRAAPLIVRCC